MALMEHSVIPKQVNANVTKIDMVKHVEIAYQVFMGHLDVKNVNVMVLVRYVLQLEFVLIVKAILKVIIVKGNKN